MGLTVVISFAFHIRVKICQYPKKNSAGILIGIMLNIDHFGENWHCNSIRKGLSSDIGNFGK